MTINSMCGGQAVAFATIYKQLFLLPFIVKLTVSSFCIASESILHLCCFHIDP